MKSYQVFSDEIDLLEETIDELKKKIETIPLLKNTCALVACGFEADHHKLVECLNRAIDFPYIGCTGIGLFSSEGYSETSIVITLLTADDCFFSPCVTEPIHNDSDICEVEKAYIKASEELPEKEKLILAYIPWIDAITTDLVVRRLDGISEKTPIFGGLASDGWDFIKGCVFCREGVFSDRMVMMLIGGNIRPIFAVEQPINVNTVDGLKVNKADGKRVYEINNISAFDQMTKIGISDNEMNVLTECISNPFIYTKKTEDGDTIDIMRMVGTMDAVEKSCDFIGIVEENSVLNMILISKADVAKSVKLAFSKLREEIDAVTDYEYSTIICSSCAARYSMIVADKNVEARQYRDVIADKMNVAGLYLYGEFCPAKGKLYGNLFNELHNETMAIMAI